MLGKITKKVFNKLTGPIVLKDYKQLSSAIARNIEKRNEEFTICYVKKDINQFNKDISYAIDFLDFISPYHYRNIENYTYQFLEDEDYYEIQFSINYHTTEKDERFVEREIEKIANQLRKPGQSDFDIVKTVHDYIVTNYSYSEYTKHSPYIVFTMLLEKQGVCQAYSLFAVKLLKQFGIPCLYVTGYAGNERHGWNLVQLDGQWYHLDITWDDPKYENERFENQRINYNYFLLTDEEIMKDHSFDVTYYPPANSERFSIFHKIERSVQIGDILYFSNELDNFNLYMLDTKIEPFEIKKVLNISVQFLSCYEDIIYFSNYSYGGYLFSYSTKSLELKQLSSFEVNDIVVEFPYLYVYDSHDKLYRWKIKEMGNPQTENNQNGYVVLDKLDFSYYASYKNAKIIDCIQFKSEDGIEITISDSLLQITIEIIIGEYHIDFKINSDGSPIELRNKSKLIIPLQLLKRRPNQLLVQLPTTQLVLVDFEIKKDLLIIDVKKSQQFFIS